MAKKKKKQVSIKGGVQDDRFPKLVGLFCLFFTLYLFIAFSSYLFTWKEDMDKANWSVLLSPHDMDNWLGRLGAVLSHQFFYYGFGFSSFILVFLLFTTGMSLIVETPLKKLIPVYKRSLLTMLWTSFLLGFIFQGYEFPWGGAFGGVLISLLDGLVGSVGIIAILLFAFLGFVIWNKNPNFKDGLSVNEIKAAFSISNITATFRSLFRLTPEPEPLPAAPETKTVTVLKPKNNVLKPEHVRDTDTEEAVDRPTPAQSAEDKRETILEVPKVIEQSTKEELEDKVKKLTQNQLALDLEKAAKEKAEAEKEDADLTMEISKEGEQVEIGIAEENKDHFEPYDPTLDLPKYENPVIDLLESYDDQKPVIDRAELESNKDQIIETLLNYKIEIVKIKATIGPTVTLYEIIPAPGVRISKIKSLEDDIALSLAALGIRIIAPIPGKGTIGIEVPNRNKQIVSLKEVLASPKFKEAKMDLPIALGKTISDEVFIADLAKMPHLLIAGATGQGKSVGINTVIMSLLYKKHPSQLKLILIDPKKVELSLYNRISAHYLGYLPDEEEAIVTDVTKVVQTLYSLTVEMDERYNLLKKASVRNINEYNKKFVARRLNPEKGHRFMPFIVLVIDEFADLIMTAGKEVELPIGRLAQLARAVGIHLIIATQRPSVNIITGIIKANFPARLAFKVTSKIDSRTILDGGGAEQLIGRGDMLLASGGNLIRIQCAFVDTPEVDRVINHIASQPGYPEPFLLPAYGEDGGSGNDSEQKLNQVLHDLDEHFDDAARLVVMNQQGSTSMIQRRLKLGYNRAGRIMDQLENTGIVGPNEGSKARQVYIQDEIELEQFLKALHERKRKISFK
ncbi:FtsK/SpoIIIE family DNA translocase [Aureispira anguillae]|uniref:DNA translocase FtsK n=1 Tax=Aureispira anguillae TaxID=2864201 RepID=A0A915YF14_9BACT|nr:DNA translocase FtsK [Aureispira anguillae]BDS11842.1 DNA translocase FtsK [Aureispira anguillae]